MSASRSGALALAYRPRSASAALATDVALVVAGTALTALCAQVVIRLPFTPVPITGQTFAVLLTGSLLGSARGALSQALYVLAGMAGLHVFAGGGHGLSVLTGATGGYLVGFVVAAFAVGLLAERGWDRRPWSALGAMLVGNLLIYAVGLPWLYVSVGRELCAHGFFGPYIPEVVCSNGFLLTLYAGFFPFVVGDALKLLLAASVPPSGWQVVRRLRGR